MRVPYIIFEDSSPKGASAFVRILLKNFENNGYPIPREPSLVGVDYSAFKLKTTLEESYPYTSYKQVLAATGLSISERGFPHLVEQRGYSKNPRYVLKTKHGDTFRTLYSRDLVEKLKTPL